MEELELLKNVFISNGYPEKLVLKTVQESWAKETMKAVLVGIEQEVVIEKKKKDYFKGSSQRKGRQFIPTSAN